MRHERVVRTKTMQFLRSKKLIETTADDFFEALKLASNSTIGFLQSLHNDALGMGWIPSPILPRKMWPKRQKKAKRAVAEAEHIILLAAVNEEWRLYFQLLWFVGAAQTDAANLTHANIDWQNRILRYDRKKLNGRSLPPACLVIGKGLPERDRLVVAASINSDPVSFASDKPESVDAFLSECQSRQTVAGESAVAKLTITVSKSFRNNAVSLYSLSAFSSTLLTRKLRERLVTFGVACSLDCSIWVQLFDNTPPFNTGTLIFNKAAPANFTAFPRKQRVATRNDLCHSSYVSLPLVPDDFKLNVSSSNQAFDLMLNELCICASLIFLADI